MNKISIKSRLTSVFYDPITFICDVLRRFSNSKSEGVRRLKLAGIIAATLTIIGITIATMGPFGALCAFIVFSVVIWIYMGFKRSNSHKQKQGKGTSPKYSSAERDATEFTEVKSSAPQRKTIITCPNCTGQLRVLAGKYIDVTCSHCSTIFRTHT